MRQTRLRMSSTVVVFGSIVVALLIPRQEIGHTEPSLSGGPSEILYDHLIVTRSAVLVVGLVVAGLLYVMSRRERRPR